MNPRRRARAWWPILALVVLSTLPRLLLILCPGKYVDPSWVYQEEVHRGNIAQEIIDGPLLSLQDYHHAPNVGGSLVVGIMAVPLFLLLGPTLLALRIVPLLFNAATVALLFLVLDRHVGRRAAWMGGLLFALAPPGYSIISVTAWGTHLETGVFAMACLLLFLELGKRPTGGLRLAFILGLLGGFAMYFGYMSVIFLLTLALFQLLYQKLFFLRARFAVFAGGFAVGFLPWITYNASHGWKGLFVYQSSVAGRVRPAGSFLDQLVGVLLERAPRSFYFRSSTWAEHLVLEWSCYLALLALAGVAVWSLRHSVGRAFRALARARIDPHSIHPGVIFLAYLPIFAVVYSLMGPANLRDNFAHDERYMTPLFPFLCLSGGVGLAALSGWRRGGAHLARIVTAAICALFLSGTLASADVSRYGSRNRVPGTSIAELAKWTAAYYRLDLDRMETAYERLLAHRPARLHDPYLYVLGQAYRNCIKPGPGETPEQRARYLENLGALDHMRKRVAPRFRPYFSRPFPGELRVWSLYDRKPFLKDYRRFLREKREEAGR